MVAAIKAMEEALASDPVPLSSCASISSTQECQVLVPPAPKARKVFLTSVGGGAFGNRFAWIRDAIFSAVENPAFLGIPLDIRMVNFRNTPRELAEMEKMLKGNAKG